MTVGLYKQARSLFEQSLAICEALGARFGMAFIKGNLGEIYRHSGDLRNARLSLERRGDASTGWSMAWKVNFWARFLDGNHAFTMIRNQLTPAKSKGKDAMRMRLLSYVTCRISITSY